MSTDTYLRLNRLASRPWASLVLSETEQAIRRAGLEDEQPEGILVPLGSLVLAFQAEPAVG